MVSVFLGFVFAHTSPTIKEHLGVVNNFIVWVDLIFGWVYLEVLKRVFTLPLVLLMPNLVLRFMKQLLQSVFQKTSFNCFICLRADSETGCMIDFKKKRIQMLVQQKIKAKDLKAILPSCKLAWSRRSIEMG